MVKWLKTALIVVFVSLAAFAQDNVPQWELYGGYQYTRISTGFVQDQLNLQHQLNPTVPLFNFGRHQNLNGWNFGGQENVNHWFGGVVDVSGNYVTNSINLGTVPGSTVTGTLRTRIRVYTMMAGPQFTWRRTGNFQPFARALFGGAFARTSINGLANGVPLFQETSVNDEGFALGGGGGTDLFFSRYVGLRLAVDYIRTYVYSETLDNFRGTAGLVFHIGSK